MFNSQANPAEVANIKEPERTGHDLSHVREADVIKTTMLTATWHYQLQLRPIPCAMLPHRLNSQHASRRGALSGPRLTHQHWLGAVRKMLSRLLLAPHGVVLHLNASLGMSVQGTATNYDLLGKGILQVSGNEPFSGVLQALIWAYPAKPIRSPVRHP